jgi:UDP-N-acetylglucosamine 1-carboxyvinyltransferase
MDKYVIRGEKPLFGEIEISGAKNAAVAIIPAALLVDGVCRIENIPQISDVTLFLSILESLGARIKTINRTTMEIDCSGATFRQGRFDLMRKIRASYYLLGAMLGRFGEATVTMPGGCDFGVRPIDQHLKGFSAMGADTEISGGLIRSETKGGLRGATVYLDVVSVGATMNIMIAAVLAKGRTVIENAAREPHIVDLANFLNSCGADIRGAGTDVIKISGVRSLHGGTYSVIPDLMEAGTYIAAVAACGGEITLANVIPKHLDCFATKFMEMGVEINDLGDAVLVRRTKELVRANFKTMPYPGFPTDMQPPTVAALCLANGTSIVSETIFNSRFRYLDELKRMGAHVQADGQIAIIEGVQSLTGAPVQACDLRAGAALVIAGLAAHGTTEISDVSHIERGYENFVDKLRSLGADIRRVEFPDPEEIEVNA